MGNYASRGNNAEDAINQSLAQIEEQNQDLLRRQRRHDDQIVRLIAAARACAATGDRAGALVLLRRQQKFQEQSAVIGNMIETLGAHGRSLETKLITSETMGVMKSTAKQLSHNTLSLDAVDDFMVYAEETQAGLRDVTHAMSSGFQATTDEDLLALLVDETNVAPSAPAPTLGSHPIQTFEQPTCPVGFTDDESFLAELEAEITQLMLPCVPEGGSCDNGPPPPPNYSVATKTNRIGGTVRTTPLII